MRFFVFLILLCAATSSVQAETFKALKKYRIDSDNICISEASAQLVVERLFKDFPPSKEVLLSFERNPWYKLQARFLQAFQPYLKASPEQQFAWMEKFLKENGRYYDHPTARPWSIGYGSAYYVKGDDPLFTDIYKKFPKKKGVCITGIFIQSPNVACIDNQRLSINFTFESGDKNNSAALRDIGLSPHSCDL